ncbi:hypothetical protein P3W45_000802 [Vairimorpha bombi]
MKIKDEILKVLNNNIILNRIPQIFLPHTDIEELDISDIINLCIPVINGKYYDQLGKKTESIEQYKDYVENIEDLDKWNKLKEIYKNMEDTGLISRNDKIYMYNIKKSFRFDYIDWEDREWIYSLIEYLFILCIEDIHILNIELEMIKLKKEESNNKNITKDHKNIIETYNIKRSDILVNRIKPKYTLDQFADKLMKQIANKDEIANKDTNKNDIANKDKEENKDKDENKEEIEIKEDLSNIRMKDEINDDRHINKGNTDNVG